VAVDHHERMKEYYDRRALEYDDAYLEAGVYVHRKQSPEELRALDRAIRVLPPARVLDVGCGTGFFTQHLRGEVTGLDQSKAMLEIAHERVPRATFVRGDALNMPFADRSFDRAFASNLYGLLRKPECTRFLAEAWRVSNELVVIEPTFNFPEGGRTEGWEERRLSDGLRYTIYRRYFTAEGLAEELGGRVLFEGRRFVMVAAST
jgi:ubiquinone/menaquinone biosynthesis C-methylase UbiE